VDVSFGSSFGVGLGGSFVASIEASDPVLDSSSPRLFFVLVAFRFSGNFVVGRAIVPFVSVS
jgi:hypothetical protein